VRVPCEGCTDPLKLAARELGAGKLGDMVVRRPFPDGSTQDFRVDELNITT
jgi:hypothetical protein